MGDLVKLQTVSFVDEPPDQVLEKAKDWGLTKVLIVGVDADGNLKFGGSISDAPLMNWLLDAAKKFLHENARAS